MNPTFRIFNFFLILTTFLVSSCAKDDVVNIDLSTVSVRIITPNNLETLSPNTTLDFNGKVEIDDPNNYSNLRAVWESDIDGILNEGGINSEGIVRFSSNNLSRNIHRIKLNIFNAAGEAIYDEVLIYNAIWLFEISNDNNKSVIKWSKTDDNDFEAYELYRSYSKNSLDNRNGDLIHTTTTREDTSFIDTEAILGNKHYYKAFIKRKTNAPNNIGSNKDSIIPGDFIKLDYPLYKMVKDPKRNYVYGIINVESIFDKNNSGYGLVFINTENLEEEKRILSNVRFTDIDLSPSGDYLYLCSRSNLVHTVNLNSQDPYQVYSLTSSAHKIAVGVDRFYTHITPPTSGSTEFRIYNLVNSSNIPYDDDIPQASNTLRFRHGDFELGENGVLYHGGSNSSGSTISKISTENDIFSLTKAWNSGDYQWPQIILNHNKLYWNHYLLDTELNKLGEFLDEGSDVNIQAVAPNGNLALGWSRVFNTANQSIIGKIPIYYDNAVFLDNDYVLLAKNENPIGQEHNSTLFFYKLLSTN